MPSGVRRAVVPSKRTQASLRFDGYARTRASPRHRMREGGMHKRGRRGGACKLPPWKRQRRKGDRGQLRVRCVFTRLGLRGFWGGEGVGREDTSRASDDEEVGSRTPSQSVDCGALARLGQSSLSIALLCAHVCVCT